LLFPALPVVAAHPFRGVYVTQSGACAPIQLVPAFDGDDVHRLVQRTGSPFTAREADDLFLAIFDDDAAAVGRLASLRGLERFVTTWS
jgi:hypothetical protein